MKVLPHLFTFCATKKSITVLVLCLQPIIALLRPEPTSPYRVIFRLIHGGVGHGSHLLAGGLCSKFSPDDCTHRTVLLNCFNSTLFH